MMKMPCPDPGRELVELLDRGPDLVEQRRGGGDDEAVADRIHLERERLVRPLRPWLRYASSMASAMRRAGASSR
jgi:hypothetical protein